MLEPHRRLEPERRRQERRRIHRPVRLVESHDGDIYGQTVNVCARLVDAAAKGEIVGSEAALEGTGSDAEFVGERRFKNVPEPMRCFRVAVAQEPPKEKGPREAALSSSA